MKNKIRLAILTVGAWVACISTAIAVVSSAAEIADAHRWAASKFDAPTPSDSADVRTTIPPFSFKVGDRSFPQSSANWKLERTKRPLDTSRVEHVCTWTDGDTGLVVRCVAIEYTDFPAVEWTIYLRNDGKSDTPIIEQVKAIDTNLQGAPKSKVKLHYSVGDKCSADSYEPKEQTIPADGMRIVSTGGRPTQVVFPYYNLAWPTKGAIVVLSWAGQWSMEFTENKNQSVHMRGGQELTHFKLHPGEQVRSPMVLVLFYHGDWLRGQNLFRRWMIQHNMPKQNGKPIKPLSTLCTGNYYPGLRSNAAQELKFIREHLDRGITFDLWWQDAGWYPCGNNWSITGTWEVDRERFPKGLREVSDFVHSRGITSIVWFEPERVHPGTWLAEKHPEWVHGDIKHKTGLLKLGDPAVRAWLIERVDKLLVDEAIDIYRQDFNMDPLSYWRAADVPDRQGITEIRHIEGYFAYWDELRQRHPGMFIDSCASGGRRNDLETLRRALPLLRSDYYNTPAGQQCHTYGLSLWFPYQGTGAYLYNMMNGMYWSRSGMVAECAFGPDTTGTTKVNWDQLRTLLAEWRELGDFFYGDFYPLTPYSLGEDAWMAWQYNLPEKGKAAVQVFRRSASPYMAAKFPLQDLDVNSEYVIRDLGIGKTSVMQGKELMAEGIPVSLEKQSQATIIIIEKKQAGLEK